MSLDDEALRLLASDLQEHGVAILAGAGVSFAPPACAPLFRPLRDGLLKELIDSLAGTLEQPVLARARLLFSSEDRIHRKVEPVPEVLFEALHGIQKDRLFEILRILLALPGPNAHHRFVADLAGRGLRLLITTNFEDGFERALREIGGAFEVCADGPSISRSLSTVGSREASPGKLPMWKVHGTLEAGSEESIRVTLSQIARESLDVQKFEPVVAAAIDLPLLVVGYSGYDRDLSQVLIRAGERGRRLYWLSMHQPEPDAPALRILQAWRDRGRLLVGDLSELCASLATRLPGARPYTPPTGVCGDQLTGRFTALGHFLATMAAEDRLASLAALCSQLADFDTALAVLTTLEERAVRSRSGQWLLFSLMMRTGILRSANRGREIGPALQRLQQLREAMGPVGDPQLFDLDAALLHEIGGYFRAQGRREPAEDAFRKALAVGRLSGDAEIVATVSQSLGALLSHLGKLDEARTLFGSAVAAAHEAGNRVAELKARHELAIVAFERRQFDEASALLTENLAGAREIGASDIEVAALFELGIIAQRGAHDDDEAHRLFTDTRQLAKLIGTRSTELNALLYLGDLEQERGEYATSIATLSECAAAAAEIGNGSIQATAMARRARSYALLDDAARARADLAEARPLAERWHPALLVEIDALSAALGG